MKKILLNLILIIAFTSCSVKIVVTSADVDVADSNDSTVEKQEKQKIVYYNYDSLTDKKIENSMKNIIHQLLAGDKGEKNIYVETIISPNNAGENDSAKFESYLQTLAKKELHSKEIKTDTLQDISLKIRYKQFGTKGILVNCFLIDMKNKKIISSSKTIIAVNSCAIFNSSCTEKMSVKKINNSEDNEKRIIGLADSECKENCNGDKKIKKEEKVDFSLINYK